MKRRIAAVAAALGLVIESEWVPRPVPPRRHQEDDVNRADIETAREEAQGATA